MSYEVLPGWSSSGGVPSAKEWNNYIMEDMRKTALEALEYIKGYHDSDDRFTKRCDVILAYIDNLEQYDHPLDFEPSIVTALKDSIRNAMETMVGDTPDETPSENLVPLIVETESGEQVEVGLAPESEVSKEKVKKPGRPKKF